MDKRRKWLALLIEEGLGLGILQASDLLRHLPPQVLATDLPADLLASVLQTGLDAGTFEPSTVVTTLGPERIAAHLPLQLVWNCLDEAANHVIKESPLGQVGASGGGAAVGASNSDDMASEETLIAEILDE